MHDRAYAHYMWAYRYRRRNNATKFRKHLDRGDHYARVSFGVDHEDQLGRSLVILKPSISDVDEAESRAWSFVPANDAEQAAIDGLLVREYRGHYEPGVPIAPYGQLCAYRSNYTGGLYIISEPTKQEVVNRVEEALRAMGDSDSPRDIAARNKIYIAEDWRDGMLLIQVRSPGRPAEGWRDTKMFERFAYYHYMNANVQDSHLYINESTKKQYESDGVQLPSHTVIPDHFFEKQPPTETFLTGLIADISSLFVKESIDYDEKHTGRRVTISMSRSTKDPSELILSEVAIVGRGTPRRGLFNEKSIKPESRIKDSVWEEKRTMSKHRARMVLGIARESPEFEVVQRHLDTGLTNAVHVKPGGVIPNESKSLFLQRCRILINAAKALQPKIHTENKCDFAAAVRSLASNNPDILTRPSG